MIYRHENGVVIIHKTEDLRISHSSAVSRAVFCLKGIPKQLDMSTKHGNVPVFRTIYHHRAGTDFYNEGV